MANRFLYGDSMKRLRLKAHEAGATHPEVRYPRPGQLPVKLNSTEWNAAGNCQRPVTVTLKSRPVTEGYKMTVVQPGKGEVSQFADVQVRCRECPACLKARTASWRYRAKAEWRIAPRTWLCTLTFTPEEHYRAWAIAHRELSAQGVDAEKLDADEAFEARHRICGTSVTKWFKRLRKAGHVFRYLEVCEAHKSGLPHYHVLVHEASSAPIAARALKAAWETTQAGHFHCKLVTDVGGATYATKYLLKTRLARVRASIAYGALDKYVLGPSTGENEVTQ